MSALKRKFSFKRNSVKTFLFFLVFTSFLWLFIQFSKNYTKVIEAEISYVNIPEDRLVNENSDLSLRMKLNGNGFRLVNQSWIKPKLKLNIEDAVRVEDNIYFFKINKEDGFLRDQLDFKGRILSVRKDTLMLHLDFLKGKKVVVQPNASIKFMAGYGSDEGLQLIPDSVYVTGPDKIIDSIKAITTEKIELSEINENVNDEVHLAIDSLPKNIGIEPQKVSVKLRVSKFTEGSREIPISLVNVPDNSAVTIFPKNATVIYRVALDKFESITSQDFRVVADYNKVSPDSPYLILEIENAPDFVHDLRLREKQVQFVILK
ncbi:CdaR family protein [Aquimarina brevivitae]|uniref:YbbR-like protein n=1 Tax=Aquimarina brevivitae TaxID=323412 RepID=A0A4Q7NYQ9_9FLAO|nr:YbbR-like domain-containing protein [Aquimarina brevivitae]RZS92601.1 YbbR-like protein [Aquimarina brevivitae]